MDTAERIFTMINGIIFIPINDVIFLNDVTLELTFFLLFFFIYLCNLNQLRAVVVDRRPTIIKTETQKTGRHY